MIGERTASNVNVFPKYREMLAGRHNPHRELKTPMPLNLDELESGVVKPPAQVLISVLHWLDGTVKIAFSNWECSAPGPKEGQGCSIRSVVTGLSHTKTQHGSTQGGRRVNLNSGVAVTVAQGRKLSPEALAP